LRFIDVGGPFETAVELLERCLRSRCGLQLAPAFKRGTLSSFAAGRGSRRQAYLCGANGLGPDVIRGSAPGHDHWLWSHASFGCGRSPELCPECSASWIMVAVVGPVGNAQRCPRGMVDRVGSRARTSSASYRVNWGARRFRTGRVRPKLRRAAGRDRTRGLPLPEGQVAPVVQRVEADRLAASVRAD
jgi:hypothetical protein